MIKRRTMRQEINEDLEDGLLISNFGKHKIHIHVCNNCIMIQPGRNR